MLGRKSLRDVLGWRASIRKTRAAAEKAAQGEPAPVEHKILTAEEKEKEEQAALDKEIADVNDAERRLSKRCVGSLGDYLFMLIDVQEASQGES